MRVLCRLDYLKTVFCLLLAFSLVDCRKGRRRFKRGNGKCKENSLVEYNLTFFGDWSKKAFPKMYPRYRPHAQWSKLVGRTHGGAYRLWSEGEYATPALQKFVEERSSILLDREAQGYSDTLDIFTAAAIQGGVGRSSVRIFADGTHSKVSFVTKLIPSPDWFVGINGLDLCKNGRWRRKIYANLRPMDAGTDKGLTYTSPNWPSHPQDRIFQITPSNPNHPASSFYYKEMQKLPRIAHVIIERVVEYHRRGQPKQVQHGSSPYVVVIRQEEDIQAPTLVRPSETGFGMMAPKPRLNRQRIANLENEIKAKMQSKAPPRYTFSVEQLANRNTVLADEGSQNVRTTAHMETKGRFFQELSKLKSSEPGITESDFDTTYTAINKAPTHQPFLAGQTRRTVETVGVEEKIAGHNTMHLQTTLFPQDSERMTPRPSTKHPNEDLELLENVKPNEEVGLTRSSLPIQHLSTAKNTGPRQNFGLVADVESKPSMESSRHAQSEPDLELIPNHDKEDGLHKETDVKPRTDHGQARTEHPKFRLLENAEATSAHENTFEDLGLVKTTDQNRDALGEGAHSELQTKQINPEMKEQTKFFKLMSFEDEDGEKSSNDDNKHDTDVDDLSDEKDVDGRQDAAPSEKFAILEEARIQREQNEGLPLDCLVHEWLEWTPCSKTCGFGVKVRTREIIRHSSNGGQTCPRLTQEVLCGSMRNCKWNHFSKLFSRRTRRRRRHHHG